MSYLCNALGATDEIEGWIHTVLLAMNEPSGRQPSILILDDFNSLGKEDVNKAFIKKLYGLLGAKKNIYVVLMVSDKALATEICKFNNGQRLRPLPNTYTGEVTGPIWNDMKWSRKLLIDAIKYTYPNDFPEAPEDPRFAFVSNEMTPLQAIFEAQDRTRQKKIPGSAKKKK